MARKKHQPGCPCCCNVLYRGNELLMVDYSRFDDINGRYLKFPLDGTNDSRWTFDHYHNRIYAFNGSRQKIRLLDVTKLPDAKADINYTDIINRGASFFGQVLCTASEDEKIYYVEIDAPDTGNAYVREVGFDGTGDTAVATIDVSATIANGEVVSIEHCRANDKLYYLTPRVAHGFRKIYRCDRDGTNEEVVIAPTTDRQITPGFSFDNVREKLYYADAAAVSITPYNGKIFRCDLDGTNIEELYDTGDYAFPQVAYNIRALRYSHSRGKIIWSEGSNITVDTTEPEGLYHAGFDGSDPVRIYQRRVANLSDGSTSFIGLFDLGCGWETTGTATHA